MIHGEDRVWHIRFDRGCDERGELPELGIRERLAPGSSCVVDEITLA
jgi:hypothetical protein